MFDVITIGDAVIDTHINIDNASVNCDVDTRTCKLCLDYAGKIPITNTFQALGGNAANTACGLAKLGLNTAILSTLGNDSNGRMIANELKKNNVNTSLLHHDAKTKTRYSVVLNFKGERTILSYHEKRNYRFPAKLPAVSWIYYSSLSEGFQPFQEKLLSAVSKHPTVKLAFNPGSFQLKKSLKEVREVIPLTDMLIVNLEEAETILGTTLKKEKTYEALINKLILLGAREAVITDAERGAFTGDEDEIWSMNVYPTKVISKTGAGDAFSAGYLTARFLGHDLRTALTWGIANSTSVIAMDGPQNGLLDQNSIKKFIQKNKNIFPKRLQ
jgi:ribokinase